MNNLKERWLATVLAGSMMLGSIPLAGAVTAEELESPVWITEEDVASGCMPTVDPWTINEDGMLEIQGKGAADIESGYLGGWNLYMRHQLDSNMPSSDGNIITSVYDLFSTTSTWDEGESYYPIIEYIFNPEMHVSASDEPRAGIYNFMLNRHHSIGVSENLKLEHQLEVTVQDPAMQKLQTCIE